MTYFEKKSLEEKNDDFVKKLRDKGVLIPEISDVLLEDEEKVSGHFVSLYSLKTFMDDVPFYFAPFVALSPDELGWQISCCTDYKMIICRLGFYDCSSGKLFVDYEELGSVHEYFMQHSSKYRDINKVFGNISQDLLPSIYSNVCDMIVTNDKINQDKLDKYVDFLHSFNVFVPDYTKDKSVLKKIIKHVQDFVTPT